MSTSLLQNRRNLSSAASLLSTTTLNSQNSRANHGFSKYRPNYSSYRYKHHVDFKNDYEDYQKYFGTDLGLKLNQAFQTSPRIDTPKENSLDLRHLLVDNVLSKGDFTVFQGTNLYDFFTLETEPKHVSQVCLVNDHFMLVKMPETCWRRSSQIESILEENESDGDLQTTEVKKESRSESGSSAARYFRCKRNCKISPVHDDSGEHRDVDNAISAVVKPNEAPNIFCKNNIKSHDKEVFSTRTTITGRSFKNFNAKNTRKDENQETTKHNLKDNNVSIEERSIFSPNAHIATSKSIPTQAALRRDNHFNSSMRESIELSSRGALVTPDITAPNGNIATYYEHRTEQLSNLNAKKDELKPQGNFNAIRWILRAFRTRSPRKPKSKIHAVIYKTYFVHWNKPSSLEANRTNDAGQSLHVVEVTPKLRRSQSAIF